MGMTGMWKRKEEEEEKKDDGDDECWTELYWLNPTSRGFGMDNR